MMQNPLYNDNYLYSKGSVNNNVNSLCVCLFNYKISKEYSDIKIMIISSIQEKIVILLNELKNDKKYPQIYHDLLQHHVFSATHNKYGIASKWRAIIEKEAANNPVPTITLRI